MKARSRFCALMALMLGSSAVQAQISDNVVKIGVLSDMSAGQSDSTGPGSVVAARMAVEDFGGKVLDQPIEVVSADHQNKPDVGSNIVRQWLERQQVDVVADVPTSSVALAVQTLTRERDRIFLNSSAGSSDLSGPACSPTAIHWTYDTYSLANGTAGPLVSQGADTWYFITADYAFGHALERDTSQAVTRNGGKVSGTVRHPMGMADFSSPLLQAQASQAKVIALADPVGDTATAAKQAGEFGIQVQGQKLVGLLIDVVDLRAIGLPIAQGMLLTTSFYWDRDDETRAFAKRFFDRHKRMPTQFQAGVYSSIMHYLKAVQAAGTDEAKAVVAKMREMPVNDFFARNGRLREDGRMVHDMYLMQVKSPAESKGEWDLLKLVQTIPGERAFRPLDAGGCPLVAKDRKD
ncbi:ABC transporter substrate-binding protein [Methylobacterium nodulans]|uniref:ABC transporter substrate-binding protein n=1 Tax=Methylobacterium nodulans (strain LMG 21967 / CNCM I-2342 / ORS 2060) TaxID=460265 RepID=B8IMF0_METNO|nr:ABC transporter substrate-binding protein [Methylobacterium nodulans]ACL58336.1 ABC transporter substrate-binding protein [Methylobacterium nodulans ORS 2060]